MSNKICNYCGESFKMLSNGHTKYCDESCYKKYRRESRMALYQAEILDYYVVYYIPSIHYVGFTKNLKNRMRVHEKSTDINNWRVLYCNADKKTAAYHEALFQSVLSINGLNF